MSSTYSTITPWGLLAYTVADDKGTGNSLDAAAKDELKAICDACDFAKVGMATQVDFKNIPGVFRAVLQAASRDFDEVSPDEYPFWRDVHDRLAQSELEVLKEKIDLNSARGDVLSAFLRFGHEKCPAERHVVYFYGHSHGPMGLYFDKDAQRNAPKLSLRLNDLADSLTTPDCRASLVVFRDCFMSTIEAAYQLRGAAQFMLASQSEVPIAGVWPWRSFMDSLTPGASSGDQAQAVARALGRFLDDQPNRGKFTDAPMTLLNLDAAEAVAALLKTLVDAVEHEAEDGHHRALLGDAFEDARVGDNSQSNPGDPALIDVATLCDNLQRMKSMPAVVAAAAALGAAVAPGGPLVVSHHAQRDPSPFRGISLYYMPVAPRHKNRSQIFDAGYVKEDNEHYEKLALNVATGWHRIALNPFSAR